MSEVVKISRRKRVKGFIAGFKDFIMKGNVVDMAVGVVIGGAFGRIITSLVNDIILPPIGVLLGGVDFKDLRALIHQTPVLDDSGEQVVTGGIAQWNYVYINYGNFIQVFIEFLIIAFSIYIVIYFVVKRRKMEAELLAQETAKLAAEKEVEAVVVPEDIQLLTEIRDLLSKK